MAVHHRIQFGEWEDHMEVSLFTKKLKIGVQQNLPWILPFTIFFYVGEWENSIDVSLYTTLFSVMIKENWGGNGFQCLNPIGKILPQLSFHRFGAYCSFPLLKKHHFCGIPLCSNGSF